MRDSTSPPGRRPTALMVVSSTCQLYSDKTDQRKEDQMASATAPSRDELIEQIHHYPWAHSIDLGNGIVTPGQWGNHNPTLWKAITEIDYRGKKVLDIGCWDGLWSFEAEKRGAAEIYATDLITHRNNQKPTFELAAQILNSKAKYFPRLSVYDVETLGVTDFDLVLFAGVYYHLKDPLRALCTLRRVMKEGAILLVEGAIIDLDPPPPAPAVEANRAKTPARGLRHHLKRRLPPGIRHHLKRWLRVDSPAPAVPPRPAETNDCYARFYYHNLFCGDHSNWWVPTIPCLRQWVECNFFEIEREDIWRPGNENVRYVLTARAARRKDPRYIREEDDLRPFDLNEYP